MVDTIPLTLQLGETIVLADIRLSSSQKTNIPQYSFTTLRFLSFVDPSRIPLYIVAGPSLDVYTGDEATERWFSQTFLSTSSTEKDSPITAQPWWTLPNQQSPLGILVSTTSSSEQPSPSITELLFYATTSTTTPPILPTPPVSSPQHSPAPRDEPQTTIHIHALPLSSTLLYTPPSPPLSPSQPPLTTDGEAHFLPLHPFPSQATPRSPSPTAISPQKRRLTTLFDEAAEQRRKIRKKGGESISAAASRLENGFGAHRRSLSLNGSGVGQGGLSRTPSLGEGGGSRPGSRRGGVLGAGLGMGMGAGMGVGRGRSSLSRVASVALSDAHDTGSKSRRGSLARETTVPPTERPVVGEVEAKNKDLVSRIVMAGMRLYGLQQRKRRRRSSIAPEALGDGEEHLTEADKAADEEYKVVYHQTLKGACLAFRRQVKDVLLPQETVRDIVDRLLVMFCTDPLARRTTTEEDEGYVLDTVTPVEERREMFRTPMIERGDPFQTPLVEREDPLQAS